MLTIFKHTPAVSFKLCIVLVICKNDEPIPMELMNYFAFLWQKEASDKSEISCKRAIKAHTVKVEIFAGWKFSCILYITKHAQN